MTKTANEIRPEIHHNYSPLTREEIKEAYVSGATVTGFAENIVAEKEVVRVRLGNDIMAYLPFSEVTIYPLRFSAKKHSKIPTNIRCILFKKIRVKITSISEDEITLSRKQNMLEAYHKLLSKKKVPMYITEVIEKSAFGDIGEGINGKLLINDVCRTHIHHVSHRLKPHQTIDVCLIGVDSEQRFAVSYRQTFKPFYKEDYPIGTDITGTVGDWIKIADTSTYYVEVTPQVPAILTIHKHLLLKYGSKVECTVTGANNKGLYLELKA